MREGTTVAILSLGARLQECLTAADTLGARGIAATVADARFAKPLDHELIGQLARHHRLLLTVEEGSIGGFGSHVQQHLLSAGLLDSGKLRLRSLVFPDRFIDHGTPAGQYREAGLDADGIVAAIDAAVGGLRPVKPAVRAGAA